MAKVVEVKIDKDVREVLEKSRIEGSMLFLPADLDRKLYLRVNEVLALIGGKWTRGCKAHVFNVSGDAVRAKFTATLDKGSVVDEKKTFQFYPTPDELAGSMAVVADIREGDHVLEPSVGDGNILRAIRQRTNVTNKITMVELDLSHSEALRRVMDTFDPELAPQTKTYWGDFLVYAQNPEWEGRFDKIIANPPFTDGQDVKHLLAMWHCLKPGGRLVCIVSAGVEFRDDLKTRGLRDLIKANGQIARLHSKAFASSGTDVNTCMVVMQKPAATLRARLRQKKVGVR